MERKRSDRSGFCYGGRGSSLDDNEFDETALNDLRQPTSVNLRSFRDSLFSLLILGQFQNNAFLRKFGFILIVCC